MEYKLNNMCKWEIQKACFLIDTALELGMDLESYGEVNVNQNSGYTYLWSENYNFSLYMPINCELKRKDIHALWTSPEDGEEREISIEGMTLLDIEKWAEDQDKIKSEEEGEEE